jgi:regulator of protease activity HflC (stomatin/prohibitin superfamily)
MNRSKIVLISLTPVYIILFFMVISMFRTIGVGQVGIVTRFGRVVGEDQSGFHLIAPWPFEGMTGMNVQIQKSQVDASAATLDLQEVDSTIAVNYNLTPQTANQVYREVGPNYVATVVDPIVQETFKAVTAQYNATDLIQERAKVQAQSLAALTTAFNERGITVDNLNIVDFQFSSQYSSAIEAKQVAAQNVLTQQYKLQAAQIQAQANQAQTAALTPAILEQQAIAKWSGTLPTTLVIGDSAASGAITNIPLQ